MIKVQAQMQYNQHSLYNNNVVMSVYYDDAHTIEQRK